MLLVAKLLRGSKSWSNCEGISEFSSAVGSYGRSTEFVKPGPQLFKFCRAFESLSGKAAAFPSSAQAPQLAKAEKGRNSILTAVQKAFRGHSTYANAITSASPAAHQPLVLASHGIAAGLSNTAQKQVGWWLGGCAAWVASMVILGGLTRLTRSGLSMTEWKFTGERPPSGQDQWSAEFQKYQQSPEYKRVNRSMSLEEFKFIYWMEYAHRMWGRLLGVAFAGPALYFAVSGKLNRPLAKRLSLLFLMGGTQGFVGWWMVRSGLKDPENVNEVPRVSPYRLAAHLGSAFLVYSVLLWTSLSLLWPRPILKTVADSAAAAGLRKWMLPLSGLVAFTGMSGAFVAGLDAGHAYNTFPLMGGHLVPEEYWSIPGWRNIFENTAAVQFHHRLLALTTLTSVASTWLVHRRAKLPSGSRGLLHALVAVTALQVTLGVTTLLTYVPAGLGAAHQATALALFSTALATLHSLTPQAQRSSAAMQWTTPVAAAAVLLVGAAVIQTN